MPSPPTQARVSSFGLNAMPVTVAPVLIWPAPGSSSREIHSRIVLIVAANATSRPTKCVEREAHVHTEAKVSR